MMNSENKKGTPKGRGALIALCVVLSIILVVLVAATVYVEVTLGRIRRSDQQSTLSSSEMDDIINATDPHDPDFTGPIYNKEDVTDPSETAPEIINGEHVLNILLVGSDTRDTSVRGRSDSMILCTVDTEKKTLTMTSFLRDMYLSIPGYKYGKQRINVAYMVGGFPMLYDTLRENFGVVVDYGVEVDFESFTEVIDQVGGVDITLTTAEASHLRGQGYDVHEGLNHMDGATALAHARNRTTGYDGDFSRTNRQRAVLEALVEKAATLDVTSLMGLVDTMIPLVVTDMTDQEIFSVSTNLAPIVSELELVSQRIPADGTYEMAMVDEMSVLLPNFDANRKLLQETIGNP